MATRTVAVNFTANTAQYVAGVSKASAATGGMTGAVSGLTRSLIGPGALLFAAKTAFDTISESEKIARRFDNEMVKLSTQIGLTASEIDEMRRSALMLGGATTKGPQELAEATFFIASAGLRGAAAMDVLRSSAQLSAIGMGETKVIADLLTSAVNAFGEESISAAEAADDLVSAVRLGKLEADQMAGAMGRLMPIAAAIGTTFNDVSGMMAAMSRTGTDAATASTQLRSIMMTILSPTNQVTEAFTKYGTSQRELLEIIEEEGLFAALLHLNELVDGQSTAFAELFPNQRAFVGVMDLMGPGLEANTELMREHAAAAGLASEAYAGFAESAEASVARLDAAIERRAIERGRAFEGLATNVRDARAAFADLGADSFAFGRDFRQGSTATRDAILRDIEPALRRFQQESVSTRQEMRDTREQSDEFAASVDELSAAALRLRQAAFLDPELLQAFTQADLATLRLGGTTDAAALSMARLIEQLVGEQEAVLDLSDVYDSWDPRRRQATDATVDAAREENALARALGLSNDELRDQLNLLRDQFDERMALLDPVRAAIRAEQDYAKATEEVNELIREGKQDTDEYVNALFDQEFAFLRMQAALSESGVVMDGFIEHLNVMTAEGRLTEEQVQRIIERLNEQGHAMALLDGTVVNTRHVHTITTVGAFDPFTGHRDDVRLLEGRARGGPVMAGRAYLVGEEGPELIVPQGAGHVMTANQTSGMLGGSTYNVNVHMPPGADGEQVVSALRRWERSNGPIPVGVR